MVCVDHRVSRITVLLIVEASFVSKAARLKLFISLFPLLPLSHFHMFVERR